MFSLQLFIIIPISPKLDFGDFHRLMADIPYMSLLEFLTMALFSLALYKPIAVDPKLIVLEPTFFWVTSFWWVICHCMYVSLSMYTYIYIYAVRSEHISFLSLNPNSKLHHTSFFVNQSIHFFWQAPSPELEKNILSLMMAIISKPIIFMIWLPSSTIFGYDW